MRRIAICFALAGLVVSAPACKKGTGVGGKGAVVGAAASALDIMPEDTAIIGGISFTKLTSSKLWEQYSPLLLSDGEAKEGLAKLKESCGLDPIKDLESVVVGANGDLDEKKFIVLVKGKFDEPKLTKCVAAMAEKESKKVTAKTTGKITEITEESGKTHYIGWASSDTIVIVPSAAEGEKAAIEAVLAGKSSAKNNKDLAGIMANVNTSDTVWVAMAIPAAGKLKDSMANANSGGPPPKAIWMNLAYQKDLELQIGARFASDKEAKDAVDKASKEFESAKTDPNSGPYLKSLKVEAKGADAVFSLKLEEKQVDELITKLQQVIPLLMMMGGGGGGGGGM